MFVSSCVIPTENIFLYSALKQFINRIELTLTIENEIILKLIYGWGNDWSADEEYLLCILKDSLKVEGQILECGSGLSTILLGVVAEKTGNTIWSFEHIPKWAGKVSNVLQSYKINSVHLEICPLKDYGEYTWYDPSETVPDGIMMVVCDGPPGETTQGGRYGLLPVMKSKLALGCTILLDDVERSSEHEIAKLWAQELDTTFKLEGTKKPYARIVVPAL